MKKRIAVISILFGLILSFVVPVVGFSDNCNEIKNDVIRLHILANSDSKDDQRIKLTVRDALLESGNILFTGQTNTDNAELCLESGKDSLIDLSDNILKENGFNYTTDITLGKEYYETRTYGDITMPAGTYLSLKVILGNGEGHNWWCVMFPPLCLPAATEKAELDLFFENEEIEVIQSNPEFEVRFKIIEVIERIKNNLYILKH